MTNRHRSPVKKVVYLANAYSVHVRQWLLHSTDLDVCLEIATAAHEQPDGPEGFRIHHLVPAWLSGPSVLRYLWLGLRVRFDRAFNDVTLHAHCTSGNGFAAWVSGRPYTVTTYGSEVLNAADRGRWYQRMIHAVLRGAKKVTATSSGMVDVLINQYGIPRERIHLFMLPCDYDVFCPASESAILEHRRQWGIDETEPVWMSIKRVVPLSRIVEMVQGFNTYCDTNAEGRLVIVSGDQWSGYSGRVKELIRDSPHQSRICLIEEWLSPSQLAEWLQVADFGVSITKTDQLSSSVLETMACGTLPVLIDIDGYRPLRDSHSPVCWIDSVETVELARMFTETAQIPRDELTRRQQANREHVITWQSPQAVHQHLRRLYDLPQTAKSAEQRAA